MRFHAVLAFVGNGSEHSASIAVVGFLAQGARFLAWSCRRQFPRNDGASLWMPTLLCLLVLLVDVCTPVGMATSVAYVPLVFCSLWYRRPLSAFVFAAIATALMVIGFFARAPTEVDVWMPLASRLVSIGAVWFVATLVYMQQRMFMRSENKLNAVVDYAVDGLISVDEQGAIEHFNPASERIFGYKLVEVVGRNIEMLMSEPGGSEHGGGLLRYLSAGQAHATETAECEVRAKRKDGSTFPMELVLSCFQLKDGRHFPGILRDISVRKQVAERKALFAAIVASSDDAIISETLGGIITSWNVSAERLLGYMAAETIGKHASLIVPPERMEEEAHLLAQLSKGEQIQRFETERLNKDGRRICVSLSISPVQNTQSRIIGASKIMRDIAARKKYEANLLHYTRELERSNQELDDFAHIASHDLKEPLRGLLNSAVFLQEDYEDKLDAKGVSRLQRQIYLCQRMEHLINDLLYFSRLGRQELAICPTDLNAVIHDIAQMMEATLQDQHATIAIPIVLPTITCDKTRVTEVFRNLITNAVKYNDKKQKSIEIGTLKDIRTNSTVEYQIFYVKDNGIGINEVFHDDIFQIFKRLNQEDDDRKGTGVGLTFVRKIIDRHGGRIWLESTPGEGTTFYFTLLPNVTDARA